MKKMKQWMKDLFNPEDLNPDLDIFSIAEALNDSEIRKRWFLSILEEIQRLNRDVDKRLLSGSEYGLTDLCARRKAIQDMLELVLSVKRQIKKQDERPNLLSRIPVVDLDRMTA